MQITSGPVPGTKSSQNPRLAWVLFLGYHKKYLKLFLIYHFVGLILSMFVIHFPSFFPVPQWLFGRLNKKMTSTLTGPFKGSPGTCERTCERKSPLSPTDGSYTRVNFPAIVCLCLFCALGSPSITMVFSYFILY